MKAREFLFSDLCSECRIDTGTHRLNGGLGVRIVVPPELQRQWPYNAGAYDFLRCLRGSIEEYGIIEFPDLPVNRRNHTLAQRDPSEHTYSRNNYLTTRCQQPHQDTPPHPTAFWLPAPRKYSATWVLTRQGAEAYFKRQRASGLDDNELHRELVPQFNERGLSTLVNQRPGLVLLDNSEARQLYHARTCNFLALEASTAESLADTPMYAFNEVGLLNYLHSLDERRGEADIDADERARVAERMRRLQGA